MSVQKSTTDESIDLINKTKNILNPNKVTYDTLWNLFAIITLIYFIVRWIRSGKNYDINMSQTQIEQTDNLILFFYFCLSVVTQLSAAFKLTKDHCNGNINFNLAIYSVLIPWLIMFGALLVILIRMPSWKAPFSNTFGYLIVKFNGIETLLKSMLRSKKVQKKKDVEFIDSSAPIDKIYNDPSLLINEITPANYDDFWSYGMKNLFKSAVKENEQVVKNKLRSQVIKKDLISEFIWYFLVGTFITTVTFTRITTSKCKMSEDQIKRDTERYSALNSLLVTD